MTRKALPGLPGEAYCPYCNRGDAPTEWGPGGVEIYAPHRAFGSEKTCYQSRGRSVIPPKDPAPEPVAETRRSPRYPSPEHPPVTDAELAAVAAILARSRPPVQGMDLLELRQCLDIFLRGV